MHVLVVRVFDPKSGSQACEFAYGPQDEGHLRPLQDAIIAALVREYGARQVPRGQDRPDEAPWRNSCENVYAFQDGRGIAPDLNVVGLKIITFSSYIPRIIADAIPHAAMIISELAAKSPSTFYEAKLRFSALAAG